MVLRKLQLSKTKKNAFKKEKKPKNKIPNCSPLNNEGIVEGAYFEKLRGIFKRIVGDWPLLGQPPLEINELKRLFSTRPAFVDYFPFADYIDDAGVYLFTDGCSCGAVFELIPPDLDARGQGSLDQFCDALNNILVSTIPTSDDSPYILQFYLEDRKPANIATELKKNAHKEMRNHPFAQDWFKHVDEHFQLMSNPNGIFLDDRIEGRTKGWRAINRKITLVIYRKATKSQWDKRPNKKLSTIDYFNQSIEGFISGLNSAGCQAKRMDEKAFFEWLAPWFIPHPGGTELDAIDWAIQRPFPADISEKPASWDIAMQICPEAPQPLEPEQANRGIMRFGSRMYGHEYSRFISLQGISNAPRQGVITADKTELQSLKVLASTWDRMPPKSVMVWTIVPQSTHIITKKLESLAETCRKDGGHHSDIMKEQLDPALKSLIEGKQKIFYFQAGVYLRASSIEDLDHCTHQASNLLNATHIMQVVNEEQDLLPTDNYVHNLPMVFDWQHDRKAALRCTMAYTSHIAAVLPLYGKSKGSRNPCFINYNRSGEVIRINPYHKADKSRVSHSVLFGPTGSGKSATQVGQALQTMAINYPRQFFIDKGGSFALLGDYYEKMGLKVRRITFTPSADISLPPFVETQMALKEIRGEFVNDDVSFQDDEVRSYLAEMLQMLKLMVTGGNLREAEKITAQDNAYLQEALINALVASEEKGDPHARPCDVMESLLIISVRERKQDERVGRRLKELADSIKLWTQGSYHHFFNRYGEGFSDEYDVVILELGVLTAESSKDMLAVAMTTLITNITQLGEKNQYSGRHIEVYMDEAHYVTANPLLVDSVVVGVKVWRKINIWLNLATQNVADFPDHAEKILKLIEWWWLLAMEAPEANEIQRLLRLPPEEELLVRQCKKNAPYYVEGVMVSGKFRPMLIRLVPPSIALALGMTDGDEKKKIQDIVDNEGVTHLEAAIKIADQITQNRKQNIPTLS